MQRKENKTTFALMANTHFGTNIKGRRKTAVKSDMASFSSSFKLRYKQGLELTWYIWQGAINPRGLFLSGLDQKRKKKNNITLFFRSKLSPSSPSRQHSDYSIKCCFCLEERWQRWGGKARSNFLGWVWVRSVLRGVEGGKFSGKLRVVKPDVTPGR